MKRFKFSLQTVHNLRETAREAAERALAQAAADVSSATGQLHELQRLQHTARDTYAAQLSAGTLTPHEAILHVKYLAALAEREREAHARIGALEQEREHRRAQVAEAARQAQVTARLRDQHRARHNAEAARIEQNNLDEMAILAHARRHLLPNT